MPEPFDSLQGRKRRFAQEQYDRLLRCSKTRDIAEWNTWREQNPNEDVLLEKARLRGAYLQRADLDGADLQKAELSRADLYQASLKGADLWKANVRGANLTETDLCGAILIRVDMRDADFVFAKVDGGTEILGGTKEIEKKIDKYANKETNFEGVGLDSARIRPGVKACLRCNIRRKNWGEWYQEHPILKYPAKLFWCMSDYGASTTRILYFFFGFAFFFAGVYYVCAWLFPPGFVEHLLDNEEKIPVPSYLVPVRAFYFSIVTMTTLGFGDMHAHSQGILGLVGHLLLILQVLLGYVMLGTLITRISVLFHSEAASIRFTDETTCEDRP